jgi:hypothetical protein
MLCVRTLETRRKAILKTGVWDGMIGDLINGVGEQQNINKRKSS